MSDERETVVVEPPTAAVSGFDLENYMLVIVDEHGNLKVIE